MARILNFYIPVVTKWRIICLTYHVPAILRDCQQYPSRALRRLKSLNWTRTGLFVLGGIFYVDNNRFNIKETGQKRTDST